MEVGEELGRFVAGILETVKTESLAWQQKHQAEMIQLKKEKELAETEIRHQIEELEARFREHKNRVKMEEEHQTRQFGEFLNSIDDMKSKMLERFSSMPMPVALMIHHHATELLKEAWHNPDAREKLKNQNKFTELMLTMSKELVDASSGKPLPEKTLELISAS